MLKADTQEELSKLDQVLQKFLHAKLSQVQLIYCKCLPNQNALEALDQLADRIAARHKEQATKRLRGRICHLP
ncbi:MAG: hypothetical protein R6U22_01315 [Desulfohalobiaceae bacterium]